jgi:hypothetical protein
MEASAIIRLNIERFRQMLQTEPDESTRRAIENIIEEFEVMLSSARRKGSGAEQQQSSIRADPAHMDA